MDNAKAAAVLKAVEELFTEEESHGSPAIINNGPQYIGEKLGYPPAEVLVHLRVLHRKGLIALFNGFGPYVVIARDQSLLKPQTAVVTDGGKSAKLSKVRRGRVAEVDTEGEHPPEVAELLSYITELETTLDTTQARLETSERRRHNISDARNRSDEAKARAEEELRRVKAENGVLKQEADKVPVLEQQLADQHGRHTIPSDLAASIARLTK